MATTNKYGLDLSGVTKRKGGNRIWPPELRAKIVALAKKFPPVEVGLELGIHPVQLYQWRSGVSRKKKGEPKVAEKKGEPKVAEKKKTVARKKKSGIRTKRARAEETVEDQDQIVITRLRSLRDRLAEQVKQYGATIEALENGGVGRETVKLSDAMVPATSRRNRVSKAGRDAISKASKKRWAQYRSKKTSRKK